jgi:hypothetical protein
LFFDMKRDGRGPLEGTAFERRGVPEERFEAVMRSKKEERKSA